MPANWSTAKLMTNETHEERVARVKRCWEFAKTNRTPGYWFDEVRLESIELGILKAPTVYRDHTGPDYEAMIMKRHEEYYDSL